VDRSLLSYAIKSALITEVVVKFVTLDKLYNGFNLAQERLALWEDLQEIANHMSEAWCVLGDFNAILHSPDRIGGTEVNDLEIRDFADCMLNCELQEMRSMGAYYSWTNKTIWTRIDRVFHNSYWYSNFNYTHVRYMTNSLSDHTPILINVPTTLKPRPRFQFCDMWSKHPDFHTIINKAKPPTQGSALKQLENFLFNLRPRLTQLNNNNYADLHEQKAKAKCKLEAIQQQMLEDPRNINL